MVDKVFKIGVLILGALMIYVYYASHTADRFKLSSQGAVLDRHTGDLYIYEYDSQVLKPHIRPRDLKAYFEKKRRD